ncbi:MULTISPECIES: hypothetical protein [Priestia]|nr:MULTISPECIES: hypothetical protein [Priestia]MCM3771714.1 hypothetical protein [Priestia aryabhattai]MDY0939996.1 hypothetical protein [Priestia megaterium]
MSKATMERNWKDGRRKTQNVNEEIPLNRVWRQKKKFKTFEECTAYGAR